MAAPTADDLRALSDADLFAAARLIGWRRVLYVYTAYFGCFTSLAAGGLVCYFLAGPSRDGDLFGVLCLVPWGLFAAAFVGVGLASALNGLAIRPVRAPLAELERRFGRSPLTRYIEEARSRTDLRWYVVALNHELPGATYNFFQVWIHKDAGAEYGYTRWFDGADLTAGVLPGEAAMIRRAGRVDDATSDGMAALLAEIEPGAVHLPERVDDGEPCEMMVLFPDGRTHHFRYNVCGLTEAERRLPQVRLMDALFELMPPGAREP